MRSIHAKPIMQYRATWSLVAMTISLLWSSAPAQVFVANGTTGLIGKYSPAGEPLNPSLLTGLYGTEGIAVDGNGFVYVAVEKNGTISKFTTDGAVVKSPLISGLFSPWAITLDGNGYLYVANYGGSIGKYTTEGDPVNPALITGLASPIGVALDKWGHLFVSNYGTFPGGWVGSIGQYTTSGDTINASLIPDLKWNWGIVANDSGGLFVSFNVSPGRIAQYTTCGVALNAFDVGWGSPTAIALNAEDNLLVADDWLGQVGEYTSAGQQVRLITTGQGTRGVAVAIAPGSLLMSGDQTVEAGSLARITAHCKGTRPLTYQWLLHGTNAVDPGQNPVLDLNAVRFDESGAYTVIVSNAFGAVTSAPVSLSVVAPVPKRTVPGLKLIGDQGSFLYLNWAGTLGPTTAWQELGAVTLTSTQQFYPDLTLPLRSSRFYRAWQTNTPAIIPSLQMNFAMELTLTGAIGSSLRVDYVNQVGPTDAWVALDTVTLTNTTQPYYDFSMYRQPARLYRLVQVP